MTTSSSPGAVSRSPSNGASLASLPRWRLFLSMLNWRRDPGYEQRLQKLRLETEQSRERTKLIESEILRVRSESEQIEKEIEQLDRENAREKALSALIRQRCFPPESSSIPPQPLESDCGSSWS
ncbi:hypothetical protein NZK33_07040 [Cyanobium sp. FGCU-6]|nr:hypothetical protein [Cyanobium sp. FGCU6]